MLDAERKIVAITPRRCPPGKRSLPEGNDLLTRFQLAKMRRAYEGLGDAEFESLKASALEKGEPLARSAVVTGRG